MSADELRVVRWADAVLGHVLPPDRSPAVIGDLHERADGLLARGDRPSAVGQMYAREAASLVLHYLPARLLGSQRARRRSRHAPTDRIRPMRADLRHALRALRRRPAFTAIVVATLALGIGANTAVFTVVRGLVLRPLPYPAPEELVALWLEFRRDPDVAGFAIVASEPEYLEFSAATSAFAGLAAYWTSRVNLVGDPQPQRVRSANVSADFLDVLRVSVAHGRDFAAGEDHPDAARVAILTDGLWTRAFGRDLSIIGRSISIDGRSEQVIGVLPPDFAFPGEDVDLLRPVRIDPAAPAGRSSHYLSVIGRLRPGLDLDAGRADARAVAARLEEARPGEHGVTARHPVQVEGLQARLTGPVRPALWTLSGAALLVLLIACANVANLFYVRTQGRVRELGIRRALGARRRTLVGHLALESLLLSAGGAVLGVALAAIGIPGLLALGSPGGSAGNASVRVDGLVVAFASLLALAVAAVLGLAPARTVTRTERLGLQERGTTLDRSRARVQSGLLLGQLALAVLLLIGAGLLSRNLLALVRVDPGFDPDGAVAVTFALDAARYPSPGSVVDFHTRLEDALASRAGIEAAGSVRVLPLSGGAGLETLTASGVADADEGVNAAYQVASPGWFGALRIPLRRGRGFNREDGATAPPVVLVSETMARRFWPQGNAIGQTLQMGASADNGNPVMTIVGIVGDVMQAELAGEPTPQFYVPQAQAGAIYGGFGLREATLVVRGSDTPAATFAQVRAVLADLDPTLPLADLRDVSAVIRGSLADERFLSILLTLFSALALGLAAIGVYGVVAQRVVARTREIGVRIALGADRRRVVATVVKRSLSLTLAGCAVGVVGALVAGQWLGSFLRMVSVRDPLAFLSGPLLLVAVAALAAWVPARRAAGVDPVEALRGD
ncbi:MAG: ABC transporter permease [Gemmatimonadota bacterium]